jgi:hypothetical protein
MRLLRQAVHERGPVFDAVVGDALQGDVRRGSQQALLEVLTKSVIDSEGDDERGDSGSDSDNGDAGDDADESLAPFRTEIAAGYEKFKAHEEVSAVSYRRSAKSDYKVIVSL